jgi:type I restriction enzyme, S subunit
MSKDKLIPEIRFPEFLNKEDWKVKTIDELCDILNNIRKPISSGDRKKGSYPYYGASGIIDYVDDFLFDERLLLIGEDGAKWGAYENTAFLVEGRFWVNNHAHVLKPKLINDKLLESYLVKLDLHPYITGAAPPKLTLGKLKEIPVPVPENEIEQQKIASCLSSLDEVIAAHSQKLELLKDHKKGLMQNLFPQEGEKVPKYRFKEFEKDGEWVEKKLGQFGDPLMCKRIFKEQTTTNPNNGIPFYKIGTFGKQADAYISIELYEEFKSKYSFPKVGDILISASGTIGRLVVYDGSPAYFQDSNIVWLGNDENLILNEFLYHCYSIVKWQTSDGGVISRLYNSDLKNIGVKFPKNPKEQQKIALCLSSLDALVTAQAEKIEQLLQHKKGLMQGLFPKIQD